MMNRRLFLRLLLALSAAVGMSGSVLLLLERLGLLDSAQRPQIEAQRAEFEKAARKANTIEGAIVSRAGDRTLLQFSCWLQDFHFLFRSAP